MHSVNIGLLHKCQTTNGNKETYKKEFMALIKLFQTHLFQSSAKFYLYNFIVFMKLFSEAIYKMSHSSEMLSDSCI